MARKKKMSFRLNPEWMFKEPVDFEYNKYTLLGYLQKCENRFENFEIYPDFVELSLHLANLQSLIKENTFFLTEKKFEDCDDEILLKEIYPKKAPQLPEEEKTELEKTIKFSTPKVFDTFNLGKSIWNLVYDNIQVTLKKNKENIESPIGFVIYANKEDNQIYVWEYELKKRGKDLYNSKTHLRLIFNESLENRTLTQVISGNTSWGEEDLFRSLPVFEVKSNQKYPINETLVPMVRRKVMAYILQVVNFKKYQGLDQPK